MIFFGKNLNREVIKMIRRISVLLIMMLFLSSCTEGVKKTELIWHVSEGEISEETETKINDRLLELGKEVTIKFVSDFSVGEDLDPKVKTEENYVDIERFQIDSIDKYEPINFSFLEEFYTDATSKSILKNGKPLVIPNGVVLGYYNSITVEESFARRNNIQQNQLEGSLLNIYTEMGSYLDENEAILHDPFYFLIHILRDRYLPISFTTGYNYGPFIDLETRKVVDLFSIPEWEELKKTYSFVRENDLDRLSEEEDNFTNVLLSLQVYDTPYENQHNVISRKSKKYVNSVSGVGILKDSNQKQLAQDILETIYSDDILSTLIKYGVQDIDYKIIDGRIHDEKQYNFETPIGTSGLGNGFLILPNRLEPNNKLETAEKHDADAIFNPEIGFISTYDITKYHEEISEVLYTLRIEGTIDESSISDNSEMLSKIQNELEAFYVKIEN